MAAVPATPAPSVRVVPTVYTTAEAAKVARCSTWLIHKEIAAGRLVAFRRGRLVRILDEDLADWLRIRTVTADSQQATKVPLHLPVHCQRCDRPVYPTSNHTCPDCGEPLVPREVA